MRETSKDPRNVIGGDGIQPVDSDIVPVSEYLDCKKWTTLKKTKTIFFANLLG